jgi:hypothetical protein
MMYTLINPSRKLGDHNFYNLYERDDPIMLVFAFSWQVSQNKGYSLEFTARISTCYKCQGCFCLFDVHKTLFLL